MKTTIDVFYFPLDDNALNQRIADASPRILDNHEQARMAVFKNPLARIRFLIARYICKTQLSRRLACQPGEIGFQYSSNGKPSLDNTELWFSLSHCASAVVCAVANNDIGVDVESMSRCEKLVAKADRFFSRATVTQIEQGGLPPVTMFTVFWTCLEAQVKLKDSSIFSERRVFELVPDIGDHYRNNQDINLLSLATRTRDIISLASWSDFDVSVWQPVVETENGGNATSAFQLMWQPCAENAVKPLINANGYT